MPAVIRLEPTLKNTLHRLQAATTRWRPDTAAVSAAADGISLHRRDTLVDIHVDIAVSPSRPAHLTAADVQDVLRSFVIEQHLIPGTITVAVLAIER